MSGMAFFWEDDFWYKTYLGMELALHGCGASTCQTEIVAQAKALGQLPARWVQRTGSVAGMQGVRMSVVGGKVRDRARARPQRAL